MLESHLSFPVLSYYRSQHDNQSWVAALTTILDTSALLIAGVDGPDGYQARLTFADGPPRGGGPGAGVPEPAARRLARTAFPPPTSAHAARALCAERAWHCARGRPWPGKLTELRGLYEPFVNALAAYFQFALPPFVPDKPPVDNWQTSPWMRPSPGLGGLPARRAATTTSTERAAHLAYSSDGKPVAAGAIQ